MNLSALSPSPASPQLLRLHHQAPAAEPLCLPCLCLPGVHEASGAECGVSGPRVGIDAGGKVGEGVGWWLGCGSRHSWAEDYEDRLPTGAPSWSTTRNTWLTPVQRRTSTWSSCHLLTSRCPRGRHGSVRTGQGTMRPQGTGSAHPSSGGGENCARCPASPSPSLHPCPLYPPCVPARLAPPPLFPWGQNLRGGRKARLCRHQVTAGTKVVSSSVIYKGILIFIANLEIVPPLPYGEPRGVREPHRCYGATRSGP